MTYFAQEFWIIKNESQTQTTSTNDATQKHNDQTMTTLSATPIRSNNVTKTGTNTYRRNNKPQRTTSQLLKIFQCFMIGVALTGLRRFTNRPLILSSIALEESLTNLPRSATYHSNIGICQSKTRNTSTSSIDSSTKQTQQEECVDAVQPKPPTTLFRRAVHLVHRHGDRTPITPLKNEAYWTTQLIPNETLTEIAKNTQLIEPENSENKHNANGRGPFGKLTSLGLQQMIDLGTKLRDQLAGENDPIIDEHGRTVYPHVFTPHYDAVHPMRIRVRSTNFVRTIQSVQGLIQGLIPQENYRSSTGKNVTESVVPIDIRHTNWMIPDPQPRRSKEQAALEIELSQQAHLIAKEQELLPFAIAMTKALQPLLADDARDADFGVPQQDLSTSSDGSVHDIKPLSWNQLAEITKCLAVRNLLPEGISKADQEKISQHAAYRWYESFRHPKLSYYAMNTLTQTIVNSLLKPNSPKDSKDDEPVMHIWSAHDSTLICLMCAFRLEQPAVWPEYASYLLIERLDDPDGVGRYVRFSLNGQILRTMWDPTKPVELIPIDDLWDHLEAQKTE